MTKHLDGPRLMVSAPEILQGLRPALGMRYCLCTGTLHATPECGMWVPTRAEGAVTSIEAEKISLQPAALEAQEPPPPAVVRRLLHQRVEVPKGHCSDKSKLGAKKAAPQKHRQLRLVSCGPPVFQNNHQGPLSNRVSVATEPYNRAGMRG